MGQYWIPVNLDKREFIDPHTLGAGLKLWEQLATHPGTGAAMLVLCAAQPVTRGGGDLQYMTSSDGERIVGRWAGDRIALVGDYAEDGDLPAADRASRIYDLCKCDGEGEPFTDVTRLVCECLEAELRGEFTGSGWRDFTHRG